MGYKMLRVAMVAFLLAAGAVNAGGEGAERRAVEEVRAVWSTHGIGNREAIGSLLELMEGNNMNLLFVGAFYGTAYWNTETGLTAEREPAFDRLAYVTERAYEKGIEVHPVIFAWRLSRPSHILPGTPQDIYRRFDKRRTSAMDSDRGRGNVCFHDEEYREFMAEITRELVENHRIHGLQLDLIRTHRRVCICEECVEKYRAEYGRDLVQDSRRAGPEIIEWQEAGVGGLVQTIAETAKGIDPGMKISICAYIPASPSRRGMQGQVPHVWAEEGWVDFIFPMVYNDRGDMGGRLRSILDYQSAMDPDAVYPLLCLINRGGGNIPKQPEVVIEQVETVRREADVKGVGFYFHRYLTDEIATALGEGPFREKAVLPWRELPEAARQ